MRKGKRAGLGRLGALLMSAALLLAVAPSHAGFAPGDRDVAVALAVGNAQAVFGVRDAEPVMRLAWGRTVFQVDGVDGDSYYDRDGDYVGEVDRWCSDGTCTLYGPDGQYLGEEADPDWVDPDAGSDECNPAYRYTPRLSVVFC